MIAAPRPRIVLGATAVLAALAVAGLLAAPASADTGKQCSPLSNGEAENLEYRDTRHPYEGDGYESAHGNELSTSVHICESEDTHDGNRLVFWTFKETLNANEADGWGVRETHGDSHANWFKVTSSHSNVAWAPVNHAEDDDCNTHTFSMAYKGASLRWDLSACDWWIDQQHRDADTVIWEGYKGYDAFSNTASFTYTYGIVTEVPAGDTTEIQVTHEGVFCKQGTPCRAGHPGEHDAPKDTFAESFETTEEEDDECLLDCGDDRCPVDVPLKNQASRDDGLHVKDVCGIGGPIPGPGEVPCGGSVASGAANGSSAGNLPLLPSQDDHRDQDHRRLKRC